MSLDEAIAAMPKIELHKHLEGSIRISTLQELTAIKNKHPYQDPSHFLLTPINSFAEFVEKFWAHQDIMDSEEVLERIAFEVIEDAVRDNVRLLEIRYSPSFVAINHPHLTHEGIHAAILRGRDKATKMYDTIGVGLIGIIDRNLPIPEAEKAMEFFIKHKDSFIGVDLANDESKFPPEPFISMFQKAQSHGLKITIHSGESLIPTAAENIRTAVTSLAASRIGHGVMCIQNPEVMQFLKEKRIILEVCPTINCIGGLFPSIKEHPLKEIKKFGILVTISTDDPGIVGHNLSIEYKNIVENGLLTLEELKEANEVAYDCCFLPDEIKEKFWVKKAK